MPFTIKIDANGIITRTGRIGAIIRQLRTLSGRSSVHYQNSTRQFVITAPKREFCEATQRAIETAMSKLVSDIQSGRTTGSKQNGKQNGKQNEQGDKPDYRKTGTFQVPPTLNPQQLLKLQKSFGRIGRSVGNGCYLTATTATIQIKANNTRAIGLAQHALQNRVAEITNTGPTKKKVSTKTSRPNITGQFDAFRQEEADEATAETQQAAAAAAERKDLQETLNNWSSRSRMGGRKKARSVGSKMHQVRCEIAEKKGIDARTVSDREVQAEMRKQDSEDAPTTTTHKDSVKVYQSSTGPTKVKTQKVTGTAWATAAAKEPEKATKVEPKKDTLQKLTTRTPFITFRATGSAWGDDDEDLENDFMTAASAFDDEVDLAVPSSA